MSAGSGFGSSIINITGTGAVNQLVAGTNIVLNPMSGVGVVTINGADAATQAEVDAGIITNEFVSPATLYGWFNGGSGGQTETFTWKYSTNTSATDPGNGNFRGNNATGSLITSLYIDDITTINQLDISNLFDKVNGTWLVHIQQRNDATKWLQFQTNTMYIDNTGWWTLPVTFIQAGTGGSIANLTDCLFTFVNQNYPGRLNRVSKSANYSITRNDYTIECTANSFTVTLPTAIGTDGDIYVIKNSGTGIITVDTTSSQTIDGELTLLIGSKVSVTVQSNNINYIIL